MSDLVNRWFWLESMRERWRPWNIKKRSTFQCFPLGEPGGIRTHDLLIRRSWPWRSAIVVFSRKPGPEMLSLNPDLNPGMNLNPWLNPWLKSSRTISAIRLPLPMHFESASFFTANPSVLLYAQSTHFALMPRRILLQSSRFSFNPRVLFTNPRVLIADHRVLVSNRRSLRRFGPNRRVFRSSIGNLLIRKLFYRRFENKGVVIIARIRKPNHFQFPAHSVNPFSVFLCSHIWLSGPLADADLCILLFVDLTRENLHSTTHTIKTRSSISFGLDFTIFCQFED